MRSWMILSVLMVGLIVLGGCRKYEVPEYETVDTNETAYVVPLEGDTSKQVAFQSAEQLESHKVAAKRIQIPHRWNQTGRLWLTGDWIDTVRVIKVSRTPETREWSANGYGSAKANDDSLWAESADGVGFSTGFTATAYIAEPDTSLFLYSYSGKSLAQIMDTEVRARIQSQMAEFAASEAMDTLRGKKDEMIKAIRADVIPFFADKGITVTTLGQFGGFTYQDEKIEQAITSVFVAQQEKQIAKAELSAQKDRNERMRMEGEGMAEREVAIARGQADALREIVKATTEAAENPTFLEIKRLEVQAQMIARWDGTLPMYQMGGGQAPTMLMSMPGQAGATAGR